MSELFSVEIEKLTLGGYGLARHEGLVVFVPFAAPGDRLTVRWTEKKKNLAFAEIVEILEPSPHRRVAPCPVFGVCGGCQWQNIVYPEQLRQKENIVREQLSKVTDPNTQWHPIQASPTEWNYRNRIQIHLLGNAWGFKKRRSDDVVTTNVCFIAKPDLVEKANRLAQDRALTNKTGSTSQDRVPEVDPRAPERVELRQEIGSERSFSQVNSEQNEILRDTIIAWAKTDAIYPEIWDLYAGSGNFTFPLNLAFKKSRVVGVESFPDGVKIAQELAVRQNISPKHLKFYLAPVEVYLKRAELEAGGLIVLDPPRVGCEKSAIESIAYQKFSKIIYLSCNPSTLGRDLQWLLKSSPRPLRVRQVQAFDMFPQTDHIETLAEIVPIEA